MALVIGVVVADLSARAPLLGEANENETAWLFCFVGVELTLELEFGGGRLRSSFSLIVCSFGLLLYDLKI